MQSKYSTFMTKCHVKTAIVGYGGVERQSSKFYINKVRAYQPTPLNTGTTALEVVPYEVLRPAVGPEVVFARST